MAKSKESDLKHIPGAKPVKAATVDKILLKMTNNVLPKIIDAVEGRRLAAAENRGKQLKY